MKRTGIEFPEFPEGPEAGILMIAREATSDIDHSSAYSEHTGITYEVGRTASAQTLSEHLLDKQFIAIQKRRAIKPSGENEDAYDLIVSPDPHFPTWGVLVTIKRDRELTWNHRHWLSISIAENTDETARLFEHVRDNLA